MNMLIVTSLFILEGRFMILTDSLLDWKLKFRGSELYEDGYTGDHFNNDIQYNDIQYSHQLITAVWCTHSNTGSLLYCMLTLTH